MQGAPLLTCEGPFYLLLTDCVRTLRRLVPVHPRLSEVNELFARVGRPLPPDPEQSFVHGMAIVGRQLGDTISTVGLFDPDPTSGSVMLYAGWQVGGEPCGAPNEGYVPVPGQLLRAVVNDQRVAYTFWRIAGLRGPSFEGTCDKRIPRSRRFILQVSARDFEYWHEATPVVTATSLLCSVDQETIKGRIRGLSHRSRRSTTRRCAAAAKSSIRPRRH